jgi:hypothetical protein
MYTHDLRAECFARPRMYSLFAMRMKKWLLYVVPTVAKG